MGFNQMPQQKQMSQPYKKPPTQNPYQQAPSDAGPASGAAQIQAPGPKGPDQGPSPIDPRIVQRSVESATLQGGAPSGDAGSGTGGGFLAPERTPPQFAAGPSSLPRNPGRNNFNRELTEPEYQGVIDRANAYTPSQGSQYSGPTLGQAMQQYGGGTPEFEMDNGQGKQVNPLDYLRRNPYSDQGKFARLPGAEMSKWQGGTYKKG